MLTPENDKLVTKLLEGKCSEEELEQIYPIVKFLPEDQMAKVMEVLWALDTVHSSLPQKRSDRILSRVLSEIEKEHSSAETSVQTPIAPITRKFNIQKWSIAAAFLAIAGISIWLWLSVFSVNTFKTAYGEQQKIALPDGSFVTLNANSSIKFDKNWGDETTRHVWLKGEAYFEVAPKVNTGQKFQVITQDLIVEVLGTVFNVNSRHEQTSVYLEEGKVTLRFHNEPDLKKEMVPGELLMYSSRTKKIITDTKTASGRVQTSWTDGVLVFENTPLAEILKKLEDIYGIEFQLDDQKLLAREITTGLPMEDIEIVLPMLEKSLNLKINRDGNHYLLWE
jgi:ferric-dicitrate binding protein FerR (iron transport regulator)